MTIDFTGLQEIQDDFLKFAKLYPLITSISLNTALSVATTASLGAKKGMRKEWVGMRARDLKRYTYTKKANVNKLDTQFVITSRPIGLIHFGSKQNKKGVSYKLKNKRRTMRKSWIMPSKFGGGDEVFVRQTSHGNKPTRRASITPTSMFLEAEADEFFEDEFRIAFEKRFTQQVKFRLKI